MRSHVTNVRSRRTGLGLTIQELAAHSEVSFGYVTRLDSGYEPDPERSPQYMAVLEALNKLERQTSPKEVNTQAA